MKRRDRKLLKSLIKPAIVIGVFLLFDLIAFVLFTTSWMVRDAESQIHRTMRSLDDRPIALVFGGGMVTEEKMSVMQTDRVQSAIDLYHAGKVQQIIMTGDDGSNRFNEVDAMRNFAVEQGIPSENVLTDWHGYRTYDSCYRAKHVYQATSIIAVSQQFHLPRIIYICKHMGIDTIGYAADKREYGAWWTPKVREALARVLAWWDVEVLQPAPQVISY